MQTRKSKKTQEQKYVEAMERVLAKVEVTGFCWLWTAAKTSDGYGLTTLYGRAECAHRAVWMLLMGEIPKGLQLDHLCEVRDCVNPDHLEPVTKRENARRMADRRGWLHGRGDGKSVFGPQLPRKKPVRTAPLLLPMSQRVSCKNGHLIAEVGIHTKTKKGATLELCAACANQYKLKAAAKKTAKLQAACDQGLCKHVGCGTLPKKAFAGGRNPLSVAERDGYAA